MLDRRSLLALPAALAAGPAMAHSYRHRDIMIGHIWCLPAEAGSTKAFVPLAVVQDKADALIGAATPVAEAVELRPVAGGPAAPRWEIAPRRPVAMRTDGPHLLLTGLRRPLRIRDRFPLSLVFERNGAREVEVWVERAPYSP